MEMNATAIDEMLAMKAMLEYCQSQGVTLREFVGITAQILQQKIVVRITDGWKLKSVRWVEEWSFNGKVYHTRILHERPSNWGSYSKEPNEQGNTERRVIKYTWVRRKI